MKAEIRRITKEDNEAVARIIQTVMPEMGAGGFGFAIHDSEVLNMFENYQSEHTAYFVFVLNGRIMGGGGVAPLAGGPDHVCELKKMYFLREARGRGYGQLMLSRCLKSARDMGFRQCYLETFNTMAEAMKLYEKNGFTRIEGPMGSTGHFACDTFYIIDL